MAKITELRDTVTTAIYKPDSIEYFNPRNGLVATLDILYDYDQMSARLDRDALAHNMDRTLWRYRDMLPIAAETNVPPLAVGGTPLYDTPRLARDLGLRQVWVKDDGANPTGSLKDRASTVVIARALEKGIKTVSTASTGNAAAALAGVGASVQEELRIVIFVPANAPEAKIAQLLVYGAEVILIEGTYDEAFDLCYDICVEANWYCRNTGINPYTTEGKKTVAFEIAEQLQWQVPDALIVSVGDGSIISGVHKGFSELHQLGWIDSIPRLIGIQAEGSSPLVDAWQRDIDPLDMQTQSVYTVADSISAGLPRDRMKAMRAVKRTSGAFIAVPDEEILQSISKFAQTTGVFAEPSSAVIYAGAQRALSMGILNPEERVVLLNTGNGLKDVRRAQESITQQGIRVAPTLDAVRQALNL